MCDHPQAVGYCAVLVEPPFSLKSFCVPCLVNCHQATTDFIFHGAEAMVPFRLLSLPSLDDLDSMGAWLPNLHLADLRKLRTT